MQVTADARPAKTGGVRSATSIHAAATRQLFRSFASATRCDPSAQASDRYEPGCTDAGTTSLTVARESRRATAGRPALPSRTPSIVYTMVERGASASPRFRTISLTDTVGAVLRDHDRRLDEVRARGHGERAARAHEDEPGTEQGRALARVRLLHGPPHEHLHEVAPVLGAPVRVARRLRPLVGDRARVARRRPTPPPRLPHAAASRPC